MEPVEPQHRHHNRSCGCRDRSYEHCDRLYECCDGYVGAAIAVHDCIVYES